MVLDRKDRKRCIPVYRVAGRVRVPAGHWSQGVEWGVRVVPGVKGSPRDPRRLRGTSGVHQGVHGAPGISQGVKGDFRGVRGSRGTPGVSRWGVQGKSRGSKVLRRKSGVY